MTIALSEEQLISLPIELTALFRRLDHDIIARMARHVYTVGRSESIDALQIALRINRDLAYVNRQISRVVEQSERITFEAFEKAMELEHYTGDSVLMNLAEEFSRATFGTLRNISENAMLGGRLHRRGRIIPLRTLYQDLIDQAVFQVRTGREDFQRALRSTLRALGTSGVRFVAWRSGYTRRLDSSVRMNLLGGLARLSLAQADMTRERTGVDGYEITWHSGHRETHDFGGLQFRAADYHRDIVPLMLEPNCYHRSFAVMYGVSTPTYSKGELRDLEANERRLRFHDDVGYTAYEAQQKQRRFELAIRETKDCINVFNAANDTEARQQSEKRLAELRTRYRNFSRDVGLNVQPTRVFVV